MKRILLLIMLLGGSLSFYSQSPGLSVHTGLTAIKSSDHNVTEKGQMHYGWLAGVDARLVEGNLYFIIGGQYINTSIYSSKSPEFFKNRDFSIISGRFGLGFNIVRFSNDFVLRSKVLGSINFVSKSPEKGLDIDGYRELNNSFMGVTSGLGCTLGIFDIDLEYQYGIFNAFYKQADTKFNGITLTAGVYF